MFTHPAGVLELVLVVDVDNTEGEFCKRATYRPTSRDGASELRLSPIPDTPPNIPTPELTDLGQRTI